ncbi:RloB family protein [Reinekea blandensis]|uniref:RloB domain-containing protein n=1 Tax=Reinekea blandensis MED297 TaxID=314283 RepID=A4B8W1_9GAMM|nr:RloB family protein [Reinekea blandensis]EAR11062.1 hypothetical protein MED297_19282 [Reinekea sp. MED297] [Reinekea blandensis MED297]
MFSRSTGRGSKYQQKKIKATRFHIAFEGAKSEAEYFEEWKKLTPKRFQHLLQIVPIPKQDDSRSSPKDVVNDMLDHLKTQKVKLAGETDNAYVVIDVDHHFTGTHMSGTAEALTTCRQKGVSVICNSPAVEIWFICHYEDPTTWDDEFSKEALENHGGFLKSHLNTLKGSDSMKEVLLKTRVAIENSKKLKSLTEDEEQVPPEVLMPNIDLIWDDLEATGLKLDEYFK